MQGQQTFSAWGQVVSVLAFAGRQIDHCCSYSTIPLKCKHDHRQHVNNWAWMQSNQTLYTKTGSLWALVEDKDQSSLAFDQDHRNMD